MDALFILQAALGKRDLGAASRLIVTAGTGDVSLVGRFEEEEAGRVHLVLGSPDLPAGALDLRLRYNPEHLKWMGFEAGEATGEPGLVEVDASQPGALRLVRLVLGEGEAELGRLVFQRRPAGEVAQVEVDAFEYFDFNGRSMPTDATTHFDGRLMGLPTAFALHPNRPNPFNPETTIHYDVAVVSRASGQDAEDMAVRLAVYNVAGQRVRVLVDERQRPGRYAVQWDGRDDQSRAVGSGVYLYRLEAGDQVRVRRMLLLR